MAVRIIAIAWMIVGIRRVLPLIKGRCESASASEFTVDVTELYCIDL
jgi:hypothetical protein